MCHKAKAAHVASSLSIIDLISVLYENILKLTPSSFNKNNRNYFIISTNDKKNIIRLSHVSHKVTGVEFSTG